LNPKPAAPVLSLILRLRPKDVKENFMDRQIRILLVDDHSLFRESLSRLLQAEPDFLIVGDCATASAALETVKRESIDVVLLDFDLGEEQGSIFLDEAKKLRFRGRILMVTAGMSDSLTLRVLEGGASGIFLKHSPPSQLVEAIRKVSSGEAWLDHRAIRSLVSGVHTKAEEDRTAQPLNARERTVLKAVFEGLTNKEIAGRMDISESSVKAVMQQLFDRMGVRSRSQLVRITLENGGPDRL
jgi:DNA-binding NarL/FixJ family response regulator